LSERELLDIVDSVRFYFVAVSFIRGDVYDQEVLENVADRLLSNKAINQRLLPDVIEKKLYVNCLKLVFRLVGMIAASFRVTVCGHIVRLSITAQSQQAIQEAAVQRASLSLVAVDKDRMKEFAREAGLDSYASGWFFARKKQELLQNLHVSLVALILGILDDLLANTRIELLSDHVYFDIVPSEKEVGLSESFGKVVADTKPVHDVVTKKRSWSRPLFPFLAGIGVGFALLKHIE